MFRAGAARQLRALSGLGASVPRSSQFSSKLCTLSQTTRPLALGKPMTLALAHYATQQAPMDKINKAVESKLGELKLKADPDTVSSTSSTHPVFGEVGTTEDPHKDADMMAGVKNDLKTIKDTFSLDGVPREAYTLGMAGVLPYLGTSVSTVYCAWEINHAHNTGSGFLMSEQTAEAALHVLEPLQVGYGAVIISFLGAVHWGLEFAGFGGTQGYKRYAIGVWTPAVAWPTILLPVEYALITQFIAFNFLYYTDSRACKRGWTPPWYAVYRFVLTFIVGASIVLSLIGRGQIADRINKLPGPADRVRALRETQAEQLSNEEAAKRAKVVSKDEEDDEE
ncbi:hypothetical protein AUEXF2481DRAFT_30298 [Aureobasidium subglaciale EXF-2481]|uniref:Uncharacterized protein n=1 Tax=Aureobasidium subglaciale (strain EXF-2481) TaxID=1043005 RepID=A0A074Y988_AURSE|nr:uncharacterized protein AUEXF2481DRAFT_30298 [Aureobasidium subglaciale EXF-2481]KAI5209711.1 hypothetical protein E4T38_02214 [Aureobasidium subglaciale]KAI5228461.1 hypothetical protein E4T40_01993 [Aureobasidium subglaciale]KAI5231980.1 hypothetical protein E4T41_02213 [Aureobasidium subglaciale]KAI5265700.1 hypothetical protein E4T46_01991 [Aureobasidium subglaciale]KEQ94320.1 hypothetical protein AUEXF2481DRAFT_30298 [Aureobasidium subglaciale EXF-2481]